VHLYKEQTTEQIDIENDGDARMSEEMSLLFRDYQMGPLHLKNRIVMAPLTRARSSRAGVAPEFAVEYYKQRTGAGLIISEATNISPQALGYAFTPGSWSAAQVESWKRVTDAVHSADGLIVMQLWHTGRISHPDLHDGALPVSASAIQAGGDAFTYEGPKRLPTPRALETREIPGIVEDYRHAAANARAAGFDGVEVHSANNYLLEQFIRDSTNKRTDEYGGPLENRLRFPLAAVKAAVEAWGGEERVGVRISPTTTSPGETPLDSDVMGTYGRYIDELNALGIAYIHVIEGVTRKTREAPDEVDFLALRRRFRGTYIANNRYDRGLAEVALESGRADLVSFGRPFIGNPDLVRRLRDGAPLVDAPEKTYYGGNEQGYSDWPTLADPLATDR
jgi:N-ethylmaleimide reductase